MRRGGGRSAVLLCAVATLLLISSSAVSGLLDENVQKVDRSAKWGLRSEGDGNVAHRVFSDRAGEELKPLESVEVVDEKNSAVSGILDENVQNVGRIAGRKERTRSSSDVSGILDDNVQKVGRSAERRERTRSEGDRNTAHQLFSVRADENVQKVGRFAERRERKRSEGDVKYATHKVFSGRAEEELKPSESVEVVHQKNPSVIGIPIWNVQDVGRFAERRERTHRHDGDVVNARAPGRAAEELKRSESVEVVDEKKPASGILERARSFLSGLAASVRHGISNPAAFLWEKKHQASEETEKAFGRKGFVFGGLPEPEITVYHQLLNMPSTSTIESVRQSRRAGIRDVNRNRLEKRASAAVDGVSATEVLAQDEDATPELRLRSKIMGLVTSVVEEYNAEIVDPNLESTCADVLETQVKILVKSVRSALQERICNGDVASKEGRSFCNVFDNDPTMGTFHSLWMTQVNPIDVVWDQISETDVCSSGNPFSNFLKSLEEMEGMAHQFEMKHRYDMSQSLVRDHRGYERRQSLWYAGERHEHEDHERQLGQQMSNKEMKHHPFEEKHEHGNHEKHGDNNWHVDNNWLSVHQMLNKEMKHHPFEEKHEHGNHQKYGWKRLFGMFRHQKQKEHLGFEHAHQISARGKVHVNEDDKEMKHHPFEEKHEHGNHQKYGWKRLFGMFRHQKQKEHLGFEHDHQISARGKVHVNEEDKEMKHHPFEEKHGHGNHQKYGWKRLFGMLRHKQQKEHLGFEHGHQISARDVCFLNNVRHFSKGMKQYLATTCETTTTPDVIAACKFAKEHHFLVKVWLALKTQVWFRAANSCTSFGSAVRKTQVDGEDGLKEIGMIKERQLTTLPPWIRSGCARNLAKRGFSKALNLRGHVNGINHVDGGLQGLVRTDVIILAIDGHEVQDVLKNLRSLDHSSSEDVLTDFQALEDVRGAVQDEHDEHEGRPGLKSETIVRRPFHHHVNFRVSANPRVLPQMEGPRFRISAMPRVVRDVNTEMPVIGLNDVIDDVAGDSETVIETHLNKYSRDTAENRADM